MKRNALARAVKIFDFGLPLVDNRAPRIWNFVFAKDYRKIILKFAKIQPFTLNLGDWYF